MGRAQKYRVAVIGATGLVGRTIGSVLAERRFPVAEYVPVATEISRGARVDALGKSWSVCGLDQVDFAGLDYCFFTAGAAVSAEWVPAALDAGCRVIDNTSAFRMDGQVPLVVPEINGDTVDPRVRLVSCPNCTTIILVMTLAPLARLGTIKHVYLTSFQSVSGAGREALDAMRRRSREVLDAGDAAVDGASGWAAFNCLPVIGGATPDGFSTEEEKIMEETRKILSLPGLGVVPTAVRVPVSVGHALSVTVEFAGDYDPEALRAAWRESAGVTCENDAPTPVEAAGRDGVAVGRLRRHRGRSNVFAYWVVGDNLRKGAATNSVQIAELLESR